MSIVVAGVTEVLGVPEKVGTREVMRLIIVGVMEEVVVELKAEELEAAKVQQTGEEEGEEGEDEEVCVE